MESNVISLESCLDVRHYFGTKMTGTAQALATAPGIWRASLHIIGWSPKPIRPRIPGSEGRTNAWMMTWPINEARSWEKAGTFHVIWSIVPWPAGPQTDAPRSEEHQCLSHPERRRDWALGPASEVASWCCHSQAVWQQECHWTPLWLRVFPRKMAVLRINGLVREGTDNDAWFMVSAKRWLLLGAQVFFRNNQMSRSDSTAHSVMWQVIPIKLILYTDCFM